MPFFMDFKMEMKKVIAKETGWKNRTLYLKGDVFEVGKNESALWFDDFEEKELKPKRQYKKNKEV
ncbi:MAG: hypothetical protein [Bacteriophage sp.]|nr:MAG: hypothetical protein [Bacteriophage sp.]